MRAIWVAVLGIMVACGDSGDGGLAGASSGRGGAAGAGGAQGGAGAGGAQGGTPGAGAAGSPQACVPGTTQACLGPGACEGAQACTPQGTGYGPCDCGAAGAGGAGAAGASGGASGAPAGGSSGAGPAGAGGSCVALTAEKACTEGQCGTAFDGCGGLVTCPACPGWKHCTAQGTGISLCLGQCNASDAPEPGSKCGEEVPQWVACPFPIPDDSQPKDTCHVTPKMTDKQIYFCCKI